MPDTEVLEPLLARILTPPDGAPLEPWGADLARCLLAASGADLALLEWPGRSFRAGIATGDPSPPPFEAWSRRLREGGPGEGVSVEGGGAAMVVLTPDGAFAALGVLHLGDAGARAAESAELLGVLFPAFRTAVLQRRGAAAARAALALAVDGLAQMVLLCDSAGRLVHTNPALSRAVADGSAGASLLGAMERLARSLVRVRPARPDGSPRPEREVRIEAAEFRLRGVPLADFVPGVPGGVMVTAAPVGSSGLDVRALRRRFGLTRRQAEAARLLAAGLSNREIAARLGVSLFTAQKHVRGALRVLDVRSRSAVGAALRRGSPSSPAS